MCTECFCNAENSYNGLRDVVLWFGAFGMKVLDVLSVGIFGGGGASSDFTVTLEDSWPELFSRCVTICPRTITLQRLIFGQSILGTIR